MRFRFVSTSGKWSKLNEYTYISIPHFVEKENSEFLRNGKNLQVFLLDQDLVQDKGKGGSKEPPLRLSKNNVQTTANEPRGKSEGGKKPTSRSIKPIFRTFKESFENRAAGRKDFSTR